MCGKNPNSALMTKHTEWYLWCRGLNWSKKNTGGTGRKGQSCALRIHDKLYSIYAHYNKIFDQKGNQIGVIWDCVCFHSGYKCSDRKSYLEVEQFTGSLDADITDIIKEYFFTNKKLSIYPPVIKVLFSDDFPIEPKLWEVA